jgi:DNA-directed RNA polymerase specialized sigma24 family protein
MAMNVPTTEKFRATWEALVGFALRKGLFYQDAEDLVSATLHTALDQFSEDRGKFMPFCMTILNNKIKNYWRDQKPFDPIDNDIDSGSDYARELEREEERAGMRKMLDRIRKQLDDEEAAMFNALGTAFEDLESRAVSQAARSLGLEPEKGWDVFRRIQRKARALYPAKKSVERPAPQAPAAAVAREPQAQEENVAYSISMDSVRFAMHAPPPPPSLLDLARFAQREAAFATVLNSMSEEQRSRLNSIYLHRE